MRTPCKSFLVSEHSFSFSSSPYLLFCVQDIFFYLPEEGYFGLQTSNGYSTKDAILPGVIKDWQIEDQNLDLSSNYPVLCVKLGLVVAASEDKENKDP